MGDEILLELLLSSDTVSGYVAQINFSLNNIQQDQSTPIKFYERELREIGRMATEDYGRRLGEIIFTNRRMFSLLQTAHNEAANTENSYFRFQLRIAAPELHKPAWELMWDPVADTWLTCCEDVHFSRYLRMENRPYPFHAQNQRLRALIAVSSPADIASHGADPLDVDAEIEQMENAMRGMDVERLHGDQDTGWTIETLKSRLRNAFTSFDILYLACHGKLADRQEGHYASVLWLQNEDGRACRTRDEEVARAICWLKPCARPRLIILSICHSGQMGQDISRQPLGQQLVLSGVPAVISMQDAVTFNTPRMMMPVFFDQLQRDGMVDRALTIARQRAVEHQQPDWWVPVLYMNGPIGRLPVHQNKNEHREPELVTRLNTLNASYILLNNRLNQTERREAEREERLRSITNQSQALDNRLNQVDRTWRSTIDEVRRRYDQERGEQLHNLEMIYMDLADILIDRGQNREAIEYLEISLQYNRDCGNRLSEGITLSRLGAAYMNLEQFVDALRVCNEALAIFQTLNVPYEQLERANIYHARTLYQLGILHSGDDPQFALDYYQRALEIVCNENSEFYNQVLISVGEMHRRFHNIDDARRIFIRALRYSQNNSYYHVQFLALWNLGEISEQQHDIRQALIHMQACVSIERRLANPTLQSHLDHIRELESRYEQAGS